LTRAFGANGSDVVIIAREQPVGDPVRWRAFLDGDKVNVGEGADPYAAISDYASKIAGINIEVDSPDGSKFEATVSAAIDTVDAAVKP
jgi:hypothetical protein